MLQLLQEIAARGAHEHPFMGDGRVLELSCQLVDLDSRSSEATSPAYLGELSTAGRFSLISELLNFGWAGWRRGQQRILAAYQLLPKIRPHLKRSRVDKTIFELGVGYMRFGGELNRTAAQRRELGLPPPAGKGFHTLQEGSTKAARVLHPGPRELLSGRGQWLPLPIALAPEHRPNDSGSVS